MAKQGRRREEKLKAKELARESIASLFEQARQKYSIDPSLSDRYVELARKIAMKSGVRIPSVYRRQYCRKCHSYLMPGKNCRVRTTKKTITYYCEVCKTFNRIPYKAEKQKVKRQKKSRKK